MKAKYRLAAPELVDATLEVTLSIHDWKRLLAQTDSKDNGLYPMWRFRNAISDLITKANAAYEAEATTE